MVAKMKFSWIFLFLLLSNSCYSNESGRVAYTPAQYLKNFALTSCVAEGSKSKEVVDDAVASANGYMELGSLAIDAYTEVHLLSQKFLAKKYPGLSGEKLIMMKCIDLFHSKELTAIAKKYSKKNK